MESLSKVGSKNTQRFSPLMLHLWGQLILKIIVEFHKLFILIQKVLC